MHVSAAEMHQQLDRAYKKEVMSCQSVAKWCSDLNSSQVVVMDNEGSGRPTTTLAALQMDNLGTSAIQTRSGTERFSPLSHSSGSSFSPQICK